MRDAGAGAADPDTFPPPRSWRTIPRERLLRQDPILVRLIAHRFIRVSTQRHAAKEVPVDGRRMRVTIQTVSVESMVRRPGSLSLLFGGRGDSMNIAPEMLPDALTETLSGHRCVSAWLGYGEVLFLGLGNVPIPERDADGRRIRPPYKLETNFATWSVQSLGSSVSADDTRDHAERAARDLIGRPVVGWHLGSGHTIRIDFGDDHSLQVVPMTGSDVVGKDAWLVSMPNGRIVAVSCDGQVVAVDSKRPIREWFSRSAE